MEGSKWKFQMESSKWKRIDSNCQSQANMADVFDVCVQLQCMRVFSSRLAQIAFHRVATRTPGSSKNAMSFAALLAAQKAIRRELNTSIPDKDGANPVTLDINGETMSASNRKGATWKQISTKVKEFDRPGRELAQQFGDTKNWLESLWSANAKCAEPAAKKAKKDSTVQPQETAAAPLQLQPQPSGSWSSAGAAPLFATAAPPNWNDFASMVASHMRSADRPALQNGGVGDQLGDRLQRIEDSQGRLVGLAVAECRQLCRFWVGART